MNDQGNGLPQRDGSPDIEHPITQSVLTLLPGVIAAVVLVSLRSVILSGATVITYPDSEEYILQMLNGIWNNLFLRERPCAYPLIVRILGCDTHLISVCQRWIGSAAWLFCAYAFSHLFSFRGTRIAAFILVFLYSITLNVIIWDNMILSESLSFSTWAVLLGVLILYLKSDRNSLLLASALIIATWFSFLRDSNFYILPGLFLLLVFVEMSKPRSSNSSRFRIPNIVVLVIFVIVSMAHSWEIGHSKRWEENLHNVLTHRVFLGWDNDKPVLTPYFGLFVTKYSMPQDSALRCVGKFHHQSGDQPEFNTWLLDKGYVAYRHFLLTHPFWIARTFFTSNNYFFHTVTLDDNLYDDPIHTQSSTWRLSIPEGIHNIVYTVYMAFLKMRALHIVLAGSMLFFLYGYLALYKWPVRGIIDREFVGMCAFIFYAAVSQSFMAVFGDAIEEWRHALLGLVSLPLILLLIKLAIVDIILRKRRTDTTARSI